MCEIVKKIYLQELLYVNWLKTTYGDDLRKSFCETMTRAQFHAKVCNLLTQLQNQIHIVDCSFALIKLGQALGDN